MRLKQIEQIVTAIPICSGIFTDVNQVAEYIANSDHSILLTGYLLYAYKGTGSVRSVVITTHKEYGKVMLSIFYDGYKMIHCGMLMDNIVYLIEEFSKDKKLAELTESLTKRFYDD